MLSVAFTVNSMNLESVVGLYRSSLISPESNPIENVEDWPIWYCTRPKLLLSMSVAYVYDNKINYSAHFTV